MTIRKKLIAIQLVTAFVVLASGSAVFVVNAKRQFRTELVSNVSSTAELIGENTASTLQFFDSEAAAQVLSTLRIEPHIANAAVYDEGGQIFATYKRVDSGPFLFPEVAAVSHAFDSEYLTLFRPILRGDDHIGTVFMRSDLRQLDELVDRYLGDVVEIFVIGVLLSVLLAVFLQRAISEPILNLVRTTQNVSETGDYSRRAPQTTADELGSLSASFNEMLEQIEKRDTSLLEAQTNLEGRVRERTTELQEATDRLAEALESEEEARRIAEAANQTKSTFLANMSHEIRTPMNAILGYAQILQGDRELSTDQRRAVDSISQSSEHLRGLINDVLDISKIEAGQEEFRPSEFDLRRLVHTMDAMFEMRCREKDLGWRLEEDVTATRVFSDEGKLRQVLINLLGNAVKFTSQGEVTLTVTSGADDEYRFEVTDSGPGIPTKNQAEIFEPFHQDEAGIRQGGTGLGLAIARRHVAIMGGTLSVNSRLGSGSTFFFTIKLPAIGTSTAADEAARTEAHYSKVAGIAGDTVVRALVVDDVATNRDILQQMLVRIGVDVDVVASGEQAIEQVAARMPEIVFMDIRMPGGIDGIETMRRLVEEHGAPMKIVAVTASVFEHQRQRYIDEGFDGFIDKPLRVEHVYSCLAELLGVEYEFSEDEDNAKAEESYAISLPASLHQALLTAAADHSISELNRFIDEVEGLSEEGKSLATHLRSLSRQYDMKAIDRYLRGIELS